MNILLIEDEKPAADRIVQMIRAFDSSVSILATLQSVKETTEWLCTHPAPDLIVADIQLNDGLSIEIFSNRPVASPIIFTTAFDEYPMKAFEFNSIDYLLKPIQQEKLHHALNKYLKLKQHFTGNIVSLFEQLRSNTQTSLSRLVVKKGTDFVALKVDDIAYFYTEHKIVFLIDKENKRYIVDKTLGELEAELDSKKFFRVNRKYLAHINAIAKFKPYEKGKLSVELHPAVHETIVVSQENAAAFKQWMGK